MKQHLVWMSLEGEPVGTPRYYALNGRLDEDASQTRDYCVAKNPSVAFALSGQAATHRAARSDSSRRKERLFGMTIKLHHYPNLEPVP